MKCKATKFLDNVRTSQERFDSLNLKLEECRARRDVMGAAFYEVRSGGGDGRGRIPTVVESYQRICDEIETELYMLSVVYNQYREFIYNLYADGVDPTLVDAIELHWLHGLQWSEIEAITPYTAEGARGMVKRVLKQAGDCVPPDAG